MSGFIALFNPGGAADPALLDTLTASLATRGPDRQDTWVGGSAGLGHALFGTGLIAAADLQPISLGQACLTGSVRLDERAALIAQLGLPAQGPDVDLPDAALVLRAWHRWGERCVDFLRGDFAFVIADLARDRLFLARDRFGVRQLYYAGVSQGWVAGNTLRCLLRHPGMGRQLDEQALGDFFLFGDHCWYDKQQTIFAGIKTVPPAHTAVIDASGVRLRSYWSMRESRALLRYRDQTQYLEHFREVFTNAVAQRCHEPAVTVTLSGGMDSSSIAATVRQLQAAGVSRTRLDSVTVRFDNLLDSDEPAYLEQVSAELGLQPNYLDAADYGLLQPGGLTSRPLELYQPSLWLEMERRIAAQSRVTLTGAAGDNLLAGAPVMQGLAEHSLPVLLWHIGQLRRRYGRRPPMGLGWRERINSLRGRSAKSRPGSLPAWIHPDFAQRAGLVERMNSAPLRAQERLNPRHPQIDHWLTVQDWTTDDYYLQPGFAVAQVRDPFLDLGLVELVLSLPALPWLFNKDILRRSMKYLLPEPVLLRPKRALGALHAALLAQPGAQWLDAERVSPFMEGLVQPRRSAQVKALAAQEPAHSYVNLRPLLLQRWLVEMEESGLL